MPKVPAKTAAKAAEMYFPRVSPLADIALQGRFGADKGPPGVEFSVCHPLSMAMVIARKGKSKALAETLAGLRGCNLRWAGADQYYAVAEGRGEGALHRELAEKLHGMASVSDQSHGRVTIRIDGPKSRAALAKGTPIDLHANEFPVGKSAVTQMAHVGVHLCRVGRDAFDISMFRGFSESLWEWITEQAEEFGYQVK